MAANITKHGAKFRVRWRLYLPDGSWIDRSRLATDKQQAREIKALADLVEIKTMHQSATRDDIEHWLRHRVISKDDAGQLLTYRDARKTMAQAAEEYKASPKARECCKEEAEARAVRIDRVVEILGSDRPIGEIRHSDGERLKVVLRDGWGKKKYKAVTINKHLQDAKRMFTLQMAEGVIEHNPFGVVRGAKVPQDEKISHTALDHEQIRMVIEEAEKVDKRDIKETPGRGPQLGGNLTLFLLMFFGCGLRRKEALAAKLENIDWQARSLRLTVTKNGEARTVGLGERLFALLLPRKGETGYILPRFYPQSVSRAIKRHFARCGFEMRLHDTRHTYTTRLLDLGVLKHTAQQRTGHKDSRMLDHYTHPDFGEVYEDQFPFMKQAGGGGKEPTPEPAKNGKSHLRVVK